MAIKNTYFQYLGNVDITTYIKFESLVNCFYPTLAFCLWLKINRDSTKRWRRCRETDHKDAAGGNVKWHSQSGREFGSFFKSKCAAIMWFSNWPLNIYPRLMKTSVRRETCTWELTAACSWQPQTENNSEVLQGINKLNHSVNREACRAHRGTSIPWNTIQQQKRNNLLVRATTQMNL